MRRTTEVPASQPESRRTLTPLRQAIEDMATVASAKGMEVTDTHNPLIVLVVPKHAASECGLALRLTRDKHRGYMWQWYNGAVIAQASEPEKVVSALVARFHNTGRAR